MRIAVSSNSGGLTDNVCPTFGRCQTFTIVEVDKDKKEILNSEVVQNPGGMSGGGAGIAAAQEIVKREVDAVITGNCGPNAIMVLQQAKIDVYLIPGTVENAVKQFLEGGEQPLGAPNVPGHFGMGSRGGQGNLFRGRFRGGRP
ncbi:MAG: NifB/NifX family molybdenum-iron cluster-binding protein [Candidatus Micrarchaeota archaeon]